METFVPQEESYLIIHEEKTAEQAQDIVAQLRTQHKIVELYPLLDKLDKQFRYAEKKGISHIIQIFDGVAKVKKV
jgi:histidyl-tRNA synthetase